MTEQSQPVEQPTGNYLKNQFVEFTALLVNEDGQEFTADVWADFNAAGDINDWKLLPVDYFGVTINMLAFSILLKDPDNMAELKSQIRDEYRRKYESWKQRI